MFVVKAVFNAVPSHGRSEGIYVTAPCQVNSLYLYQTQMENDDNRKEVTAFRPFEYIG